MKQSKKQKQPDIAYPNAANLNAETDFPFFVRRAENRVFSKGDVGFGVMHWHEDLQIIYVLEGNVCVKTLEDEVILSAGEGVLTNKGVIHYSIFRSLPCRYRLFRFPERFVSFYPGSPAERQVRAITENAGISLVTFRPEAPWCLEVLQHLQNLVRLDDNKDDNSFYPYDILTELTQIWQIMLYNIKVPGRLPQSTVSIRMRLFLEYIEAHYAEEISLEDLAASAGVSKTEAMRCFRKSLQTTPYRYLMEYRLSKASELLQETDLPVSEIAERTGFHQQSYFGKCFKEKTGMTPGQFRRAK